MTSCESKFAIRKAIDNKESQRELYLHVGADDRDLDHNPKHKSRELFVLSIAHFSQMKSSHDSYKYEAAFFIYSV